MTKCVRSHVTWLLATTALMCHLADCRMLPNRVPQAPLAYQHGMPTTVSTFAAAAAGSGNCGPVKVTTPTQRKLMCDLGSNTNTTLVYQPANKADSRFTPANFRFTCVANAGVGCDSHDNTGDEKNITTDTSCDSCFLYAKYCSKQTGGFVTNSQNISKSFHALVMPASACTGVENWDQAGCPREAIWDEAASQLEKGGRTDGTWGMAINPVNKRGQHQMHVHLAQLYPNLIATVKYAYETQKKAQFHLNCSLSPNHKRLDSCKNISTSATFFTPLVIIRPNHNDPSAATPFEAIYGKNPSNISTGCGGSCTALESSLLVFKLPQSNNWALVANKAGPAECFFNPNNEADLLDKCQ